MGTGFSAQDIIRCHLCDKESPTLYCELCHVHLCTVCAGKHLLDESKEHRVVSIKNRSSDPICPKCPTHTSKLCELHCEQCDVHICVLCVSSKTHNGHDVVEILDFFKGKKEVVKKDLQELKKSINPRYKKIASKIPVQKSELIKNSQKLTTIIDKRGEDIHRKIDTIINKMKSEIGEMEVKYLNALQKQGDEIAQNISEITQSIHELQKLMRSNDVCLVSDYKSRNSEFRKLPPLLNISLPTFSGTKIDTDILYEQIGSLSVPSMTTQEHVYIESLGFSSRELLDVPRIVKTVDTGLTFLSSVACLSDERIWTIGQSTAMKLHNLQGQLLKSIKTKSGNAPEDIAVTKRGNLVYTDPKDKSLNIVNSAIQTVIKLIEWIPLKVCSTSSGDFLVLMLKMDNTQTKVVRYDGPKEKQSIQFNEREQPLFSSNPPFAYTKYITENRNKDICVTDNGASAAVVVNRAGKLRFTYTGVSNKLFDPVGITSDSQGRILISDWYNCIVHIIDKDGLFLRYIDNCNLRYPCGICVDSRDNLLVTETGTSTCNVKKIRYYK
ncbi:uncharacterized protein LOC128163851 [Crassostrea angulata]|uniref:uncharacterized protein LOC128163851 n=1 Tax=Magallana angulata TaxID=2784310 RepID=UPI0022B1A158|nr:uncharacterized protein LOC128163851 [Crassostrea angulata]